MDSSTQVGGAEPSITDEQFGEEFSRLRPKLITLISLFSRFPREQAEDIASQTYISLRGLIVERKVVPDDLLAMAAITARNLTTDFVRYEQAARRGGKRTRYSTEGRSTLPLLDRLPYSATLSPFGINSPSANEQINDADQ